MCNDLSGKSRKFRYKYFKVSFAISLADKDTVKILDEFQIRMHMKNLWKDYIEFSIEGEGSDHIHLAKKINLKN